MTEKLTIEERRLTSWRDVVEAADYFTGRSWVFRGHEDADWRLQTTLERQFGSVGAQVEQRILWHFVRTAPRLLPAHLIPQDNDAAAWLGLIQHYGGPTRFLDVTRSPYIALFFAFEPTGDNDRAVWAIDHVWCGAECARIMAMAEGIPFDDTFGRVSGAQAYLVASLVHRQAMGGKLFGTFKPFTGVFPLDPWKPDARQSAQQAMFLCAADITQSFIENLSVHEVAPKTLYRLVLPASLRDEAIDQLSIMNVTAATLFPDLSGLARSLRTHTVRRAKPRLLGPDPWEPRP